MESEVYKKVRGDGRYRKTFIGGIIVSAAVLLSVTSCKDDDNDSNIKPIGANPEWAPNIDGQMLTVVEKFQSYGSPPITELTVEQARNTPTIMDAAKDVMKDKNIDGIEYNVDISHRTIDSPSPEGLLVRIYTPSEHNGPYPVIVYYHGGGWVLANLDTYDASARALADKSDAIVISVAYRLAPEHKFPAAHEDAYAAYKWARLNAGVLSGDTSRVAVAGESAGGNMAGAVCLMAKDRKFSQPTHQVLIYPVTNYAFDSPTYIKYANAKPLSAGMMAWFFDKYLTTPADGSAPIISLLKANVTGLAAATIVTAEIDPLQSDGSQYSEKLKAAGVDVSYTNYEGVTHEFFGLSPVIDDAKDAQDFIAARLKDAFTKK